MFETEFVLVMKDEVVFGQCIINHKELMMLINYKVDYIEFDCFNLMETCDEDREEIWNLRKNVAIHQHCQQVQKPVVVQTVNNGINTNEFLTNVKVVRLVYILGN